MKSFKHFITEALDFRVVIKGDNQTEYRILHPNGEEHGYQPVVISHSSAVPVANFELKKPVGKPPPKFGGANAIRNILKHFEKENPHVKQMYAVAENPEHKEHFQRIISKFGYPLTNKGFKLNESTLNTVKKIMRKAKQSAERTPAVASAFSTFKKLPEEMKKIRDYMEKNSDFAKKHSQRFENAVSDLNIGRENKYNNHLDFLQNAMKKHQVENM